MIVLLALLQSAYQELTCLPTGQTTIIAPALLQCVPVYRVLPPAHRQPITMSVAPDRMLPAPGAPSFLQGSP